MKTLDLVKLESKNTTKINLIKSRLFWTAWEKSAYYFIKNIKHYKVNNRYFKNVGDKLIYIGFPEANLNWILAKAKDLKFTINKVSDNQYEITGFSELSDYNDWKASILNKDLEVESELKTNLTNSDYFIFKNIFDFSLYLLNLVPKFNKSYRFTIGQRISDLLIPLIEDSYLHSNSLSNLNTKLVTDNLSKIRIHLRICHQLKQISLNQWLFINQKIKDISNNLHKSPVIQG